MFYRSHRFAASRMLILTLWFVVPTTSGCAITDRLDTLNCQVSQVIYTTNKLEETNQHLKETNERLEQLGEKAVSMDKKLATLEKAARRFGGTSASPSPRPATDESAPLPAPTTGYDQEPRRPYGQAPE